MAAGMTQPKPVRRRRLGAPPLLAALFCLLFFLEGLIFIPYVGLQNDEALFSEIIYPPFAILYSMRVFRHVRFPAMMGSYLGTLKAFLCKAIFDLFGPSTWSLRIPMLLAGAATVWLLFVLVRQIAGGRAALAATALLSTDAAFLRSTTGTHSPKCGKGAATPGMAGGNRGPLSLSRATLSSNR